MGFLGKFLHFLLLLSPVIATEFTIRTDRDLLNAINSVNPGDLIRLARDTTYYLENVQLNRNGLPEAPITLIGDKNTRIRSDNTGLAIGGSFWKLKNIDFETCRKGIVVHGHNNTFKSISFHDIEDEAIDLRGQGNLVKSCVFNGVNHGIVIYGRDNKLVKNSITSMASTVTAAPRSCCGLLEGNVFSGLLNVFGSDFDVIKNIANSDVAIAGQRNEVKWNVINGRLDVSGCGNNFLGNTAGKTDFTKTCYNWDDGENKFETHAGNIHNSYFPHHNINNINHNQNPNHNHNKPNNNNHNGNNDNNYPNNNNNRPNNNNNNYPNNNRPNRPDNNNNNRPNHNNNNYPNNNYPNNNRPNNNNNNNYPNNNRPNNNNNYPSNNNNNNNNRPNRPNNNNNYPNNNNNHNNNHHTHSHGEYGPYTEET